MSRETGTVIIKIPAKNLLQAVRFGENKNEISTVAILYLLENSNKVECLKLKSKSRSEMEYSLEQLSDIFRSIRYKFEHQTSFEPIKSFLQTQKPTKDLGKVLSELLEKRMKRMVLRKFKKKKEEKKKKKIDEADILLEI